MQIILYLHTFHYPNAYQIVILFPPPTTSCLLRDSKGKHSLIPKTEAKQVRNKLYHSPSRLPVSSVLCCFSSLQRFLLRDSDFEESSSRGPALSFILKKNPHSSRWGEMKLFLLCQVMTHTIKFMFLAAGLIISCLYNIVFCVYIP